MFDEDKIYEENLKFAEKASGLSDEELDLIYSIEDDPNFEPDPEEIKCSNCGEDIGTYDYSTCTYDTKSWVATDRKQDYYCDEECYNNVSGRLVKGVWVKEPLVFGYSKEKGFYNIYN